MSADKAVTPERERTLRVLVAEDDYLVHEMVAGQLRQEGYTVVGGASNGAEAVDMTRELTPDVVLMDLRMPGMDGLEAAQHIARTCPTPVIVLTAYDAPELVEQAAQVGVDAYLVKPPKPRELTRTITVARARFQALRQVDEARKASERLSEEQVALVEELRETLQRHSALSGLIPICAACKRVRTVDGEWETIEQFVRAHSEADFTHSLCPSCIHELYGDIGDSE
jgi:two-component system, response regulator PdtaR